VSLLLLVAALWMTIRPGWWIESFRNLQEALDRWVPDRVTLSTHKIRLPDERSTRIGVRVFGVLLILVSAAYLYREIILLLPR
jgi:hypothetical protein